MGTGTTEDTNDDREPRQCEGAAKEARLRNELRRNYHSGQPPANSGRVITGQLPDLAPAKVPRKQWQRPPNHPSMSGASGVPPTPPLNSHRLKRSPARKELIEEEVKVPNSVK